jgi:hypothetical protein
MSEAKGFEIIRVTKWRYAAVQCFTGNLAPPQQLRDGPDAMIVRCLACPTEWIARETLVEGHKASFKRWPLSVYVWCKKCDNHGMIPNAEIPNDDATSPAPSS